MDPVSIRVGVCLTLTMIYHPSGDNCCIVRNKLIAERGIPFRLQGAAGSMVAEGRLLNGCQSAESLRAWAEELGL